MKTISKLAFLLIPALMLSCNSSGNSGNPEKAGVTAEPAGKTSGVPVMLTRNDFLTKVFDYQTQQEWKYQGDMPAIIDFYADWCKPCKMIAPIMEDLAKEYEGRIHIYKINTDKERELAGAFQIQSIPAVLFIPKTGQPQMSVGALPKEEYVKMVENFLLPSMKQ